MRSPISIDEVLLFHHIPKTGGLSLISILDQQFHEDEILPLHSTTSTELWDIYSEEQKARFRLVRGHFTFLEGDQHIYKHITQNPIRITLLRDPVARVQSAYRYLRRNPKVEVHVKRITVEENTRSPMDNPKHEHRRQSLHVEAMENDFSTFVLHQANFKLVYNVQTRMILGPISGFPRSYGDADALNEDELFVRAKAALDAFAFVGITERFVDSLQLLCYTFGWPEVEEVPRINVDPSKSGEYVFSEEDLKLASKFNTIDKRLYDYARGLFFERLEEMKGSLG